MADTEKKMRSYEDWSGGNWGSKGSYQAGKQSPHTYRAVNMQVYANGSIGPRPGWKLLTTTGTAPTSANTTDFWGAIWVPSINAAEGKLLFVSRSTGASTRILNMSTLAWEATFLGAMSAISVEGPVETNPGDFTYQNTQQLIVGGNHIYDIEAGVDIALSYPSSFAPTHAIFYKDRLYAYGDATFQNRVYYSDFRAFSTFTAGNFFDVGTGGATATTRQRIRGAWVMKDQLMFVTTAGTISQTDPRGEYWALQGADAIVGSLVRIAKGRAFIYPSLATIHREMLVGMDTGTSRGSMVVSPQGIENGALDFIRPGNDIYQFGAGRNPAATYGEEALIMPYIAKGTVDHSEPTDTPVRQFSEVGMQSWELVHGVWTKASWWNGALPEAVDAATKTNLVYATLPFLGHKLITVTNAGAAGPNAGTWRVFTRDVTLDRPSKTDDDWSNSAEPHTDLTGTPFGVEGHLWLPEEMADLGCGVHVSRVIVDFDYWKSPDFTPASTADFEIKIRYKGLDLGPDKEADTQGGADGSFDYLTDIEQNFYPNRARRVFRFPEEAWYGSFQVIFSAIRNVAFRRVVVYYDQKQSETM